MTATTSLPVMFDHVFTASGVAGGPSRKATVNIRIDGRSDTVEEVRQLVAAAPDLLSALEHAAERAAERGDKEAMDIYNAAINKATR